MLGESMVELIDKSKNITYAQAEKLRKEIDNLKETKQREEREIKHLVKLEKEQADITLQKEKMKMQEDYNKKEMQLRQEFFDKNMVLIKEGHKDMKEMYAEIMKRLPNVNMEINRDYKSEKE